MEHELVNDITNLEKGYHIIPNELTLDNSISGLARAVYGYLVSRPDGWKFYIDEIKKHFVRENVQRAIKELESAGWVSRKKIANKGKGNGFTWIWKIYSVKQVLNSTTPITNDIVNSTMSLTNDVVENDVYNNKNYIINNNNINNIKNNTKNIVKNDIFDETPDLSVCKYTDKEIIDGWNKIAKEYQLPTITLLSEQRKIKLKRILKKFKLTLPEYYDILKDRINKSLFLQGVNQIKDGSGGYIFEHSGKWHSDFDFFLRESRFIRALDNTYTDGVFLK